MSSTIKQKRGRQGEGGGQPPKYKDEKVFKKTILGYFEQADIKKKIYSKAGMLGFLDISRPTWMEYKKKYPNTTRYAEFAVEEVWVDRLASTGATGAIFYLKNAFKEEYKDRSETDLTSDGKALQSLIYLPAKNAKVVSK